MACGQVTSVVGIDLRSCDQSGMVIPLQTAVVWDVQSGEVKQQFAFHKGRP